MQSVGGSYCCAIFEKYISMRVIICGVYIGRILDGTRIKRICVLQANRFAFYQFIGFDLFLCLI